MGILPTFWRQKTRVPGLSYGVVCVIPGLTVLIEHRLVTDRQTDGHMTIVYTALAWRREVKTVTAVPCETQNSRT